MRKSKIERLVIKGYNFEPIEFGNLVKNVTLVSKSRNERNILYKRGEEKIIVKHQGYFADKPHTDIEITDQELYKSVYVSLFNKKKIDDWRITGLRVFEQ